MAKKKAPTTFDGWLGKIIDDEASPHGGRTAIARWIGVSDQSVNRRARGEVPYLVKEVEIIASHVSVPTAELVNRALARLGGIEKLISETTSEPPATVSDIDQHRAQKEARFMGEEWDEGSEQSAAVTDPELKRDEAPQSS